MEWWEVVTVAVAVAALTWPMAPIEDACRAIEDIRDELRKMNKEE